MTRALIAAFSAAALLAGAALRAPGQQTVTNPHGELKEPCAACHSPDAWKPAKISAGFKHAPKQFPLDGAHAQTNCRACHTSLTFKGTSTKCADCHQDIHRGELGSNCALCHSPRNFLDRSVMTQRHQTTRFPLTGAHVMADCMSCHPPVQQGHMTFVGRPVECVACHMPAYVATANPPHQAAGFPTVCEACHTTVSWDRSTFNHSATLFPLTGAHLAVQCTACHGDGVYKGKPTTCVSCHLPDYNGTAAPAHAPAGFPVECADCHSTLRWTDATFDHQKTLFPLTGAHLALICSACHSDNIYKGKPTTCVSCHLHDYNTATPSHSASGFGTQCDVCHSTATWTGAVFDHSKTLFPLTGAHIPLACTACHSDGVYAGKPTTCVSCHQSDYNATNNPAHAAAGFPTVCQNCHTTATWLGATFNHDASFFPIYSGAHNGKWSSCATCHTNAANYVVFSCINGCHSQTGTNNNHRGVSGYRYDSQSCYSCHPRGRAG